MTDSSSSKMPALDESRLWKFLNSGIGLLLITGIFIPILVFGFQQWRDERQKSSDLSENIFKLDLEIDGRLSQYLVWLHQTYTFARAGVRDFKPGASREAIVNSIRMLADRPSRLIDPKYRGDGPLITELSPEYEKRSLISLYIEKSRLLKRSTTTTDRSSRYKDAIAALMDPAVLIGDASSKLSYDSFKKNFERILLSTISGDFAYTDCFDC